MAVWRSSGSTTPEYNPWDGSAFSTAANTANVGSWRIMAGAEAPTREEIIVLGVDDDGIITGEIWDSNIWSALPFNSLATVSNSYWWGFAVAYEQSSGDAVIVWNNGGTGTAGLSYRVWDGSLWSPEFTITTPLSGEPKQMQLAANPDSDEITLIVSNSNSQDYAIVWDGASWGHSQVLSSSGTGDDRTDVYVAYEKQNGRAMVVYGQNSANCYYRVWNGASWSAENSIPPPGGVSGAVRWTTLGSDPISNNIAMGVLTRSNHSWLSIWNGTAWESAQLATSSLPGQTYLNVAVAFEGQSGEVLAAYGENASSIRYRTWSAGSGWSAQLLGPALGATPNSVMLDTDSSSDHLMLSVQDSGSDLNYVLWNGTAWDSPSEQETDTGETKNQPFLFLWSQDQVASAFSISGNVFEDVNYGGGSGVDHATALTRAGPFTLERAGVTIELYDSGGNHVSAVSPQNTDASGNYSFTGLAPGSYTVRVVNSSVTSTRAGSDGSEFGVQTYRIDGDGEPIGTGATKVGGEVPTYEDAAANSGVQTLTSLQGTDLDTDGITEWTQSIVTVDVSGGDVTDVDFGFNFDTIVNTNDKDQGSLRQFILNANLLTDQASLAQNGLTASAETSIFMIPSSTDPLGRPMDPGFDAGRGVAVIAPVSEMEALVDSGTFLDGTTQTVNIGDTNPGVLGYVGPVGLGVDGVIATGDEPTLSGVAAPEMELQGNSTLEFGLRLQGNDITLRGLAVYGFGIDGLDANILVGHHSLVTNNTNCRIEANVLGTMADSFTDPGLGVRSPAINIYVRTADQGAIVGNLLGFVGRENVRILSTALNWQVTDNEIRAGGRETTFGGVTYIAEATGELKRNLIADDNATAVLGINTDLEIEDNTISGNLDGAIGFFDNSGSMVTTASVLQNDLTGNGSGVVVFGENGASPAITGIRISRNRFSDNAWNAIDLVTSWTPDGVSVNDGTFLGDSSVPNSCGTVPTTGNIGLDTPLLDSAIITTGTTTINGRACPGVEVEIYRAVADGDASDTAGGTDYGEGVEFLDATTADGAGDWTIMSTALAVGDHISAIAIDASGNTSEFGPNLQVSGTSLSGIVFEDVDFAGTAADYDGGVADRPLVNVDVELYNGTTDAYIASTTTTAGGVFAFGSIANGTYKVRVRSETLGDADTQPTGGFNPSVPGTWPYPLAEMTWGNGSALIGGQDPTVDDTVTGDNAGPGDTYVSVTLSGADVTGVNMGFNFELIVNEDDDANPDIVRSKQGTLRQFIKNSNAIVGVNKSWFQIPSP